MMLRTETPVTKAKQKNGSVVPRNVTPVESAEEKKTG
jgi:hypothetical protein